MTTLVPILNEYIGPTWRPDRHAAEAGEDHSQPFSQRKALAIDSGVSHHTIYDIQRGRIKSTAWNTVDKLLAGMDKPYLWFELPELRACYYEEAA